MLSTILFLTIWDFFSYGHVGNLSRVARAIQLNFIHRHMEASSDQMKIFDSVDRGVILDDGPEGPWPSLGKNL